MSMTTLPLASTRLMSNQFHHHIKPCTINSSSIHQSFFFNPLSHKNRSLWYLIFNGQRAQTDNRSNKCPMVKRHVSDHHLGSTWDLAINNSDLIYFGALLNSSWKAWILGGLLIVQFLTNNVPLLIKLIEGLEMVVEKLEETEEAVEEVEKEIDERAEAVEKAMTKAVDEVEKKINEITEAVEKAMTKAVDKVQKKINEITEAVDEVQKRINEIAEAVEKKLDEIAADELQESIDKVENVEKKVDSIIEAEVDKSSAAAKVDESTT